VIASVMGKSSFQEIITNCWLSRLRSDSLVVNTKSDLPL